MHNVGEKVVYSSNGVMEIVDIREELVLDAPKKYYVLCAYGAQSASQTASQTFVPVDNEKLVSKMRPLLTREEVMEIIGSLDSIPAAEWIRDNRARSESFKVTIEEGDRVKMISMIKLINKTAERRAEEGKKNYLADENAMQRAEKLLYSEFATVLGIDESDIPDFIEKHRG